MARALVIGGTGPTGPFVVGGLLERGYDVAILHTGHHEIPEIPPEVEHLHTDPFDADAIAATLGSRSFDVTVASYGRVREQARLLRGRTGRFVTIGGVPLYRGWMYAEDSKPRGLAVPVPEDAAKVSNEAELRKGYKILETENAIFDAHPNATVFRFPVVYGARQALPREWCIVRRVLDRRPFLLLGDGGLTLETCGYAENLAHAILLAIDQPAASAGESFNCGDEQVWSVRQVAETIARILEHAFEFVSIPGELARPLYPFLTRDYTDHRVMDISKLKQRLGYRDVVSPENGLARTVAWLLENRPEPGGDVETILQDTFDYAAEDALYAHAKEAWSKMASVEYTNPPGPGLSFVPIASRGKPRKEWE
jgi:nucleoside-diphosphate-sugar epimerase